MDKNESVTKYELVVIVDAKLTNETKEVVRKEVADTINKHGGKVINSQVWLEKHKLTFLIKKCSYKIPFFIVSIIKSNVYCFLLIIYTA